MGFFAILEDSHERVNFEIKECHLNLWVLSGLLGTHAYYLDVGLFLKAPQDRDLRQFQVAIPAGTETFGFEDLSERVKNQRTAQLIFGKPVTYPRPDTINFGEGPLAIHSVASTGANLVKETSSSTFSLWAIRPTNIIPRNSEAYIRLRFRLTGRKGIWQWKRFLTTRFGAMLDIRFSDVREAWNVKDGNSLRELILPINKLNFFVVVSSFFHLTATSPSVHYTRILEGKPWETYLGRKVCLWGHKKLSIYQWRNDRTVKLSPDNPLRVYLELGSDPREVSILNWALGLLLLFVVLGYADSSSTRMSVHIGTLLHEINAWFGAHIVRNMGGIIIAFLMIILWHFETIQKRLVFIKRLKYECEKLVFKAGFQ